MGWNQLYLRGSHKDPKQMKIFLDDVRDPPEGWTLVRNAAEAVGLILNSIYEGTKIEAISLDHDLGEHWSGYDVACFMEWLVVEDLGFKCPDEILIHSANPVGRRRIQQVIDSINKRRYSQR